MPGADPLRDRRVRVHQAAEDPGRPERRRRHPASTSTSRGTSSTGSSATRTASSPIDTMRVPVGRTVELRRDGAGRDVIHCWWIPRSAARSTRSRAGVNQTWFQANAPGRTRASAPSSAGSSTRRCSPRSRSCRADEFDTWLAEQRQQQDAGTAPLGEEVWKASAPSATAPTGEGDYGPNIAGTRSLSDPAAVGRSSATASARCRRSAATGPTRRSTAIIAVPEGPKLGAMASGPAARGSRLDSAAGRELARHRRPQEDRDPLHRHAPASSSSLGGFLALLIRTQLATPDEHVLTRHSYNEALHDARHDDGLPRRRPGAGRASATSSCRS